MADLKKMDFANRTPGEIDIAIAALTALLASETEALKREFARYGEERHAPDNSTEQALLRALIERYGNA